MAWPVDAKGKPRTKLKVAVLIRRSKGERGSTKDQLEEVKRLVKPLEKAGLIQKIDWNIVGKDINQEQRFSPSRDLGKKGDVFNEGRGSSGFVVDGRPVLNELMYRMRDGQYDGILVRDMNRFGRDYGIIARYALPDWRDDGKVIYSLQEDIALGNDDGGLDEAIINTGMTWGGQAKKSEIAQSVKAGDKKVLRGYMGQPLPEFLGRGTKSAGMSYRDAYAMMKEAGETPKGRVNNPSQIGAVFGKDHRWAGDWYERMSQWEKLGVLEDWFLGVEAVNNYILTHRLGERPGNAYKQRDVLAIRNATSGYFRYPAGVKLAKGGAFATFPNPLVIGLETLGQVDDPTILDEWNVQILEEGNPDYPEVIFPVQTQPRARKGKRQG